MRRTICAASIAALVWIAGAAFAGNSPEPPGCDGIDPSLDNCAEVCNPAQDDTDGDDCGNVCDADYDQNGLVGVADFGLFVANFNTSNSLFCHVEPIAGCIVGVDDFGIFATRFNTVPGPSNTTIGTVACP